MRQGRKAIALVGYNRPHYFRPTFRSIVHNLGFEEYDLCCFFDGGFKSRQREYRRIVYEELAMARRSPAALRFAEHRRHLGCGRTLIDARRQLFDYEHYERAFIFEDDIIVGPHYLVLSERLLDWSQTRYFDIGVVQLYNFCLLSREEKADRLGEVTVGNCSWLGYLLPQSTWIAIRDSLYEYERRFLIGRGYQQRDHRRIRQWAIERLQGAAPSRSGAADRSRRQTLFPQQWNYQQFFEQTFATGQDAITFLAMVVAGLQKLVTVVNRGRPIGVRGLHSTRESFRRYRLHEVRLDVFDSDATRNCFYAFHGKGSARQGD